jgi:hypothetical protein
MFILVINIANIAESNIEFWLDKISYCNGENVPAIFLATNGESLPPKQLTQEIDNLKSIYTNHRYPFLQDRIFTVNLRDSKGKETARALIDSFCQHLAPPIALPVSWVDFDNVLCQKSRKCVYISGDELSQIATERDYGFSEEEFQLVIDFCCSVVSILRSRSGSIEPQETIFLYPVRITILMEEIANSSDSFLIPGLTTFAHIRQHFEAFMCLSEASFCGLLRALHRLEFLFEFGIHTADTKLTGQECILVPSSLRDPMPQDIVDRYWLKIKPKEWNEWEFNYRGKFSNEFVYRIIIRALGVTSMKGRIYWVSGALMEWDQELGIIQYQSRRDSGILQIKVRAPNTRDGNYYPLKLMRKLTSIINGMLVKYFPNRQLARAFIPIHIEPTSQSLLLTSEHHQSHLPRSIITVNETQLNICNFGDRARCALELIDPQRLTTNEIVSKDLFRILHNAIDSVHKNVLVHSFSHLPAARDKDRFLQSIAAIR